MLLSVSVATDQTDYAPGETAILTASGFAAGETVQFQVLHVDDTPNTGAGHEPWQVTDGSPDDMDGQVDGNVVTAWLVNEDDSYGSTFEVTATSLTSGESATATFYDGHHYYSRYHASGRSWNVEDSWWFDWGDPNGTPGRWDRAWIGAGAHDRLEWMRVRWRDEDVRWVEISWLTEAPDGGGTIRGTGELQIDADQGVRTLTAYDHVRIGKDRPGTLDIYGTLKTPNLYLTTSESTSGSRANVYLRPGGTLYATNISGSSKGVENFQWYGGVIRPYATNMTIDASVGNLYVSSNNTHEFIVPNGKTINLGAALSGSEKVKKSWVGTLNLYSINNAYTGAFTIDAGTVALQGPGSFGSKTDLTVQPAGIFDMNGKSDVIDSLSGSGKVYTDGATLTVGGNNGGGTFSGAISGSGSLIKSGSNRQVLSGGNSFTGQTRVDAGELMVNGSLASGSNVQINSNGRLSGTGTINRPVVVKSSGILTPGPDLDVPGVLTTQSLTLESGSVFEVDLQASGHDQVNVAGSVNLSGATLTLDRKFEPSTGQVFMLIDNDGTEDQVVGTFAHLPEGKTVFTSGGHDFRITYRYNGNDVAIVPNRVPDVQQDVYTLDEDVAITVSAGLGVLANDSDAEGDPMTAMLESGPTHAQGFSLLPDGSFTYAPSKNFSGSDGFTYSVYDGRDDSQITTVTLQVNPVADVPWLMVGHVTGTEDMPIPLAIEADVADSNSEILSLEIEGVPAEVTFSAGTSLGDGSWQFGAADLTGLTMTSPDNVELSLTVRAVATEAAGGDSASAEAIMNATVTNVAPEIHSLSDNGPVEPGQPATLIISATDAPGDWLSYAFDFDADGTYETTNLNGVAEHAFDTDGFYPVPVRVLDDDGGAAEAVAVVQVGTAPAELPAVSFAALSQSLDEAAGTIGLSASLDQPASHRVIVPLLVSGAAVDGTDFLLAARHLAFEPGQTEATVQLSLIDDSLYESDEDIFVEFGVPAGATFGATTVHFVAIVDNDLPPEVMFTAAGRIVEEADVAVNVTARLSTPTGREVIVPLTLSGSAIRGDDYYCQTPLAIVIPAGATLGHAKLQMVDDSDSEPNETIIVAMSTPIGAVLSTAPGTTTTQTIILPENDAPSFSFASAYRRVSETDGTITLVGRLSTEHYEPVTVSFTATPPVGSEFTLPAGAAFVFEPNQTEATLSLTVADDNLAEGTELIVLTAQEPNGPTRLGPTMRTVIAVLDDDVPEANFWYPRVTRWEADGLVDEEGHIDIKVWLTKPSAQMVYVPVVVLGGTATPGADYYALASTIVEFDPYETLQTIPLDLKDDSRNEPTERDGNYAVERIELMIGEPIGELVNPRRGPDYLAQIKIRDNDPVVRLCLKDAVGREIDHMTFTKNRTLSTTVPHGFRVYAALSAYTDQPVTVELDWDRGDAINRSNIDPLTEPWVFGPLSQSITIGYYALTGWADVKINDDEELYYGEPTISIGIDHIAQDNAIIGPEDQVSVDVLDGGVPKVSLYVPDTEVWEYDEGVTVNVRLSHASTEDTDVPILLRAVGHVENLGDYLIEGEEVVTIPAGDKSAQHDIIWENDIYTEHDEDWQVTIMEEAVAGAEIGSTRQVSFQVLDDDFVFRSFEQYRADIRDTWERSFGYKCELAVRHVKRDVENFLSYFGIGSDGYISGGTVFFDANKNGILDFLDLDGDGVQDPGEPTEPSGTTAADGFFEFEAPAVFDRDGNDQIDTYEGQLVLAGGIDTATGSPLTVPMTAPADSFLITPATTIMTVLVNDYGLSTAEAEAKVAAALGLSGVEIARMEPIRGTLAGDPEAALIYAAHAKLFDGYSQVASVVTAAENAPPMAAVAEVIATDIAGKMLEPDSALDLSVAPVVQTLIEGALVRTGLQWNPDTVAGAAEVIAASNQHIDAITLVANVSFLEQVARAQVVAQSDASPQLAAAVQDSALMSQVISDYTGPALAQRIAEADVGTVVAPAVTVSNASVLEGDQDQSYLEFAITLDRQPAEAVDVDYLTGGGNAHTGIDYQGVAGSLHWDAGDGSPRTILVPVFRDLDAERDERLYLGLTNVQKAIMRQGVGVGTILNDDAITYQPPSDGQDNQLVLHVEDASITLTRNDSTVLFGEFSHPVPLQIVGADDVSNRFVIEWDKSATGLAGGVSFQGGNSTTDEIVIRDAIAETVSHTISEPGGGEIGVDGLSISYQGVESINDVWLPAIVAPVDTPNEGEMMTFSAVAPASLWAGLLDYAWEASREGTFCASEVGAEFIIPADDDGEYLVSLVTSAPGAATATVVQTLRVENVAPDFEAGPDETVLPPNLGYFSRSDVAFTDPGADEWTGTVNYGDGSGDLPLAVDPVTKTFGLEHTYANSGVYTVTVTIDDGDGGIHTDTFDVTVILAVVEFTQPDFADDEGAGTSLMVQLVRTPPGTNVTSQVQVAITGGGTAAGGGSDYNDSAFPMTITFDSGVDFMSVPVPINPDDLVELDETITFKVSSLSNALIGIPYEATLTIRNDDQAALNLDSPSGAEDEGPITFTASLSKPVDAAVSVQVDTTDGSAVEADSDYTPVSGLILTFDPGVTSQTFTVISTPDNKIEPHETFLVSLSALEALGRNVTIADDQGVGTIENDDFFTGRVFNDVDNDGRFDADGPDDVPGNRDDDVPIEGVSIQLQTSEGAPIATQVTTADGSFVFANLTVPAGTYQLVELVDELADLDLLDGRETAPPDGGVVDYSQDCNEITDIQVGGLGPAATAVDYLFAEIEPSDVFGTVWRDFNNDGQIDFGEAGIDGVTLTLQGTDDRDNAVTEVAATLADGGYAFVNLRPGTYSIAEQPQTAAPLDQYDDGLESLGAVSNPIGLLPTSDGSIDPAGDRFTGIELVPGSEGDRYNFGERAQAGAAMGENVTASIGFWHNKNGQALIKSLPVVENADGSVTSVGNWLAATFPNMYGSDAVYQGRNGETWDMNLAGKSNAEVADTFGFLFKRNAKNAVIGGPPKVNAQVMAVALAAYVTNENLAGTVAQDYGFSTSADGIAYATFHVLGVLSPSEAADLGLTPDQDGNVTIIDILQSTDKLSYLGLLYDLNDNEQIDDGGTDIGDFELMLRTLANQLYCTINEDGSV